MKNKYQEMEFYERFWKEETEGDHLFHGLPDWRLSLGKRLTFFKGVLKGKVLDAGCGVGEFVINISKLIALKR